MDLELVRTFVEIMRNGSFVAAAKALNISQTAVTARVKNLEEMLDCTLFIRSSTGIRLTTEGRIFAGYASESQHAWDDLKLALSAAGKESGSLLIGGETALQSPLLLKWCQQLRQQLPQVRLNVSCGSTHELYRRLQDGSLDAALVYRAEYGLELMIKQVMEEKLVMVRAPGNDDDYVFVNWGEEFFEKHLHSLPGQIANALVFDHGPLALNYILEQGGRGYFRYRVVSQLIAEERLELVKEAPEFSYPVYLAFKSASRNPLVQSAVECLLQISK